MQRLSSLSIRSLVAAVTSVSLLLLVASPASAHDPIFVEADQTSPDTGPYMPDGSISWALYGSVLDSGDTRGFEFDLRDGDELYISLLIPNIEPEISLADDQLPFMELEKPDGTTIEIVAEIREVFDEPFSRTSYITLAELREPGQAGRYRGVLTGNAASRFTVAIGEEELFFTETERSGDRPTSFQGISGPLNAWYATPAGEEPVATADGEEIEIDVDMIEEAMDAGEAEAPASALEGDDEDTSSSDESAADASDTDSDDAADSDAASDDSEGGSTSWIAPVVLGAAALLGGLWFVRSRRSAESSETVVEQDDQQPVS